MYVFTTATLPNSKQLSCCFIYFLTQFPVSSKQSDSTVAGERQPPWLMPAVPVLWSSSLGVQILQSSHHGVRPCPQWSGVLPWTLLGALPQTYPIFKVCCIAIADACTIRGRCFVYPKPRYTSSQSALDMSPIPAKQKGTSPVCANWWWLCLPVSNLEVLVYWQQIF